MAKKDERDDLAERFPAPPPSAELPDTPKFDVKLPPPLGQRSPGSVVPGSHYKLAVAATAASSFVAPIIVLGVAGWWLDQRIHNGVSVFAFVGTVLGFIVGIVALLRVIQQLNG